MPAQRTIVLFLSTALLVVRLAAAEPDGLDDTGASPVAMDSLRPVEFWTGEWDLRLGPIAGNFELDEAIAARASIYTLLDGKALLELWESAPINGLSLRYYSHENDHWAIALYWAGGLDGDVTSLEGHAAGGRGVLAGRPADTAGASSVEGRRFSDTTPFSLRWYDMITPGGVQASRKQWGMAFTRRSIGPAWADRGAARPAPAAGKSCAASEFRAYESIVGRWHGTLDAEPASLTSISVLDGCAVIAFIASGSDPDPTRFLLFSYDTARAVWTIDYLDDGRETDLVGLTSAENWTDTGSAGSRLRWQLDGTALYYRFRRDDGSTEEGHFDRQASGNP